MAAPSLSVFKTFTHSNGILTSVDADFSILGGAVAPSVQSNQIQASIEAYVGAYLDTPATYGPDTEVFIQAPQAPNYFGVYLGLTSPGGSFSGYQAGWNAGASDNLTLVKKSGGSDTTLDSATLAMSNGVWLALVRNIVGGNAELEVYTSTDGTNWTLRLSATDSSSPHTAAGAIGFDMYAPGDVGRLDNLGGGTIVSGGGGEDVLLDAILGSTSAMTAELRVSVPLTALLDSTSDLDADLRVSVPLEASLSSTSATTAVLSVATKLAATLASVSSFIPRFQVEGGIVRRLKMMMGFGR